MTYPVFSNGEALPASDLNAIGSWLVKAQTIGSGVSSVTVTGAFSADYDSYLIQWTGGMMSNDTAVAIRFGSTTTGYYGSYVYGFYSSASVSGANDNNAPQFSYIGGGDPFSGATCNINVANPFLSKQTYVSASPVAYTSNVGSYVGRLANTSSYTAFTLFPVAGTITGGTIRVYGYRN